MNFRVCMCTRTFAYFLQAFYILQAKQGHLSHVLDAAAPRNCQRVVRSSFDQSVGDAPFLRSVGSAFGALVAMHPWRCAALQMGSNVGTCVTHKALHQSKKNNILVSGPVSAEPASVPFAVKSMLLSEVKCPL